MTFDMQKTNLLNVVSEMRNNAGGGKLESRLRSASIYKLFNMNSISILNWFPNYFKNLTS